MKDFFLSTKSITLIRILDHIIQANEAPMLRDIMYHFSLSKLTAICYLKELQLDLAELDANIQLTTVNNRYELDYPEGMSSNAILFELRFAYIIRTTSFQVMDALFKHHYNSVQTLAEATNFSTSSVQNCIKQLRVYFNTFYVTISFRGKQNIVGDPLNIRLLMIYTYTSIYRGSVTQDFVTTRSQYPTALKPHLSFSQHHQIEALESVTSFDLIQKKYSITLNPELHQLFEAINKTNTITLELPGLPEQTLLDESLLFSFLLRIAVANYDTDTEKIKITEAILALNTDFTNDVNHLLLDFFETYQLNYTKTSFLISFYYLVITFIYLTYITFDITDFVMFNDTASTFKQIDIDSYQEIDHLNQFLAEKKAHYTTLPANSTGTLLSEMFFFLLDYNPQIKPLKINIQYTKNFYAATMITKNLQNVFRSSIVFTD